MSIGKKKTIRDVLRDMTPDFNRALPRHINPERMARIFLTEIRKNPKLMKCTMESLLGALMICAQVGLEPGSHLALAYLVPYKNNLTKKLECQFMYGYKGLMLLANNSGKILNINVNIVHENDIYESEFGINEYIKHKPCYTGKRGPVVRAYAYAKLINQAFVGSEVEKDELDKIKSVSKSETGPWKTWESEMQKKTAIKRLCKIIPFATEDRLLVSQDETTKYFEKDTNILYQPDKTDWDNIIDSTPEPEELPIKNKKEMKKADKPLTQKEVDALDKKMREYLGNDGVGVFLNTISNGKISSVKRVLETNDRNTFEGIAIAFNNKVDADTKENQGGEIGEEEKFNLQP